MAPGGAKMATEVEAAPIIGRRRYGWCLERHDQRPLIGLRAFRKRQRDQHAAANKPVPHQAPTCAPPTQATALRSPASRRGTQAETKNYSELVTIMQNTADLGLAP